ncbi:MAG: 1-acyl-sn-glycerol-3-phosphate acyltransferase [Bacteroidia bacterium]|nr:1-acyl-sn-glycerol-3-phosphate acyltransferase [Bacteroidia bacterium]
MSTTGKEFIDLKKIFREKNPGLYRVTPNFVISWISQLIHENDLNNFVREHRDKQNFDFAKAVVKHFDVTLTFDGLERIPETGGVVLACNHPLGGLDAMSLLQTVEARRTDLKFLVNDILMNLENLKELWLGVNKVGKSTGDLLREIDAGYSSGNLICIFPAGLVSRMQEGEVRDLEWKKSFITKSRQYGIPVIPVHISGRITMFFYRLAIWRKRLGIKSNIEMLFLVHEMYKSKGQKIHIRFGKPLPASSFSRDHSDLYWAAAVKELVYRLPADPDADLFREPSF